MKPSIAFDRWLKKNAVVIERQDTIFKRLAGYVLLDLKMIELNPDGVTPGTAERIVRTLAGLKMELERRKIPLPDIKLSKIKVRPLTRG